MCQISGVRKITGMDENILLMIIGQWLKVTTYLELSKFLEIFFYLIFFYKNLLFLIFLSRICLVRFILWSKLESRQLFSLYQFEDFQNFRKLFSQKSTRKTNEVQAKHLKKHHISILANDYIIYFEKYLRIYWRSSKLI